MGCVRHPPWTGEELCQAPCGGQDKPRGVWAGGQAAHHIAEARGTVSACGCQVMCFSAYMGAGGQLGKFLPGFTYGFSTSALTFWAMGYFSLSCAFCRLFASISVLCPCWSQ